MSSLSKIVGQFVNAQLSSPFSVERIVVAFSGGVDSSVLLHLLKNGNFQKELLAIHINHQLSPQADLWQQHCEALFTEWGVQGICMRVDVQPDGKGLEHAAREARYTMIAKHLRENDLLLTAHHQNDQAETLLLRLARGAGLKGLCGIRAAADFPFKRGVKIARPLLSVSRQSIESYAKKAGLCWVEDESNEDERLDRNFVRKKVLPLLESRWHQSIEKYSASAELLLEADELLDQYAQQDLKTLDLRRERLGESICLKTLFELPQSRRNHILRSWIGALGQPSPAREQFELLDAFQSADRQQHPQLVWGELELRRYRERLFILPRICLQRTPNAKPQFQKELLLEDGSTLKSAPATGGLRADAQYRLAFREAGLRSKPHGRAHSQSLKKLLQECGLEPWLRDKVPLLFAGERLAAVGDLWVEEEFWTDSSKALNLNWTYSSLRPD